MAGQLSQSKFALGYEFEDDPKNYVNAQRENKAFPKELIAPLLQFGFVKKPLAENPFEREDITAKMVTILLLYGGLRKSEPLHLWFNDVIPYSDFQCQAKLYHPRLARTHLFGEKQKTREEYLKERHMRPRSDKANPKSLKAHWKALSVDKSTYHADIFFLHPSAEAMFVTLYQIYLPYRSKLMEEYVKNKGHNHPFLFVSNGIDQQTGESYVGAPYSQSSFGKSYDKAIKRLEQHLDMRIERGKGSALNLHSLRHFYAQALTDAGVDKKVIQKCMHHRTINAQNAYQGMSSQKIQELLASYSLKF
ncbi:site-specific integrase [Vibrio atlanticus]|uniref:site-specific integrase n=1 Tax=Vibrio atlanticus TaxID=693153 RepID=UPI0035503570